jgi:periplasmic protein TonB
MAMIDFACASLFYKKPQKLRQIQAQYAFVKMAWKKPMKTIRTKHRMLQHTGLWAAVVAIVAGCTTPPVKPPPQPEPTPEPTVVQPPAPVPYTGKTSNARTPRDYRRDAASHLYAASKERIYKGKMPPLLYAVGVLQVDIGERGQVNDIRWMRAPSHAPEVMADIERSVRNAAPFPAPVQMRSVTYTDTWLWHKSGRFQLDTLTEGQL